jgi:hypothetical protein
MVAGFSARGLLRADSEVWMSFKPTPENFEDGLLARFARGAGASAQERADSGGLFGVDAALRGVPSGSASVRDGRS